MSTWRCVQNCGACCHLDPSERPDLEDYLSSEELKQYLTMVGEDGWCVNFDHHTRKCRIYEERPRFCRVQPETFQQMYQVSPEEFNDFAIDCCQQQIAGVWGFNSAEMFRYNRDLPG
ncbi:MAG: YkgJ family cysteine cluster protein [Oscillatoria sp. PMC 1051.18]|uniref:YkgJ family cysteine cluster protein n=1 Tax=Oscillatoria salina TaxID=331517 RepID=UPI001CCE3DB1|nr:YkgJ family cysteine cluster protein [Oscillatoria salina]MBZ8178724.1 YkgJ family cysteine cluster protein [Oscillatoria salina IIICB1]MEC4896266.1 YkgJ family cysteine cluster protein [Oscillatoria sp. PMC 1050.18]MEC5032159.1 YkgJ family cysteine cluster protein [Oscillatoria sp. PMC 1051.18]